MKNIVNYNDDYSDWHYLEERFGVKVEKVFKSKKDQFKWQDEFAKEVKKKIKERK